ncbi:hypothetical protein [Haladaptatus sp. DJG-WS-42]|uniref:hypothetical protein n=1 Tax=Haladaptatus sp. DJG-WS-42 TaxID=3120516 RepID=UPI0030CAC155
MFESADVDAYKRLEVTNKSETDEPVTLSIVEADSSETAAVFEKQLMIDPNQMEVFETDLELDATYTVSATRAGTPIGSGEVTMCDCILVVEIHEAHINVSFSAY